MSKIQYVRNGEEGDIIRVGKGSSGNCFRTRRFLQFIEDPALETHRSENPTLFVDQDPRSVELSYFALVQNDEAVVVNDRAQPVCDWKYNRLDISYLYKGKLTSHLPVRSNECPNSSRIVF